MSFRVGVFSFILVMGLCIPVGGRSAESCASDAIPVALTLSGGVSLGAYQAGTLYFSSLVFKNNPELFQTRLLTGASAGALNALFTVLSVCGEEVVEPSQSAFFKTWVGFKGQDLLAERGQGESLFSRKAFSYIANELENKWRQGLSTSCDVVLGLSVTRLEPLNDLSKIGFARQGEKINLRVRGRGPGQPPLLTNYVNPMLFPKPLLLDLEKGNDSQNFEALKQALFASSAFPLAFAPQELRTCVANTSEEWTHADLPYVCPKNDVVQAKFVDGGILDNKPLALAEKIARSGLVEDDACSTRWREIPGGEHAAISASSKILYWYSDLSATSYEKPKSNEAAAFAVAPLLLGSVFNSVRNQDSTALLEQSPTLENQIAAPKNNIPRMGDSLLGFFGFFESEFRAFDFYLGIWETREYFRETFLTSLYRGGQAIGPKVRMPQIRVDSLDELKLECLDATLKMNVNAPKICEPVNERGFVLLARLAAARVNAKRFDFRFMVDWLANERYEYRDLGLRGREAWRAPAKMKTESINAIANLAKGQKGSDRFILRVAGPVALNLIEPLPNERDIAISLGPQTSLVLSNLIGQTEEVRFRWAFGVGLENLSSWFGSDGGRVTSTPLTTLEFEPVRFNTGWTQVRFGIGGGYKFGDRYEGVVTRVGSSLTFVERVRVGLDAEAMPFQKTGATPWQILPSLGLQFYF